MVDEIIPTVPSPGQVTPDKPPTKSDYSFVGIIVSIMLMITLIVFVQYVIGDLQESYAGKRPQFETFYSYQQEANNIYTEKETGATYSYKDANEKFNKSFLLPYESKRMIVSTLINVPFFLFAVLTLLSRAHMRSSYRLGVNSFFAAAVFNMLRLLGELGQFAYTVNQKLTMYGVSAVLIIVFFGSIVYIQERHTKSAI